ncbi:MAG: hypothetical protein RMJ67_07815, partial [Elusimicrobiota bacterium]|nr:hypothetical protein [Endomicrobiia bacterium]MDW8166399.1 hypothetical protein [Elusimicrobiota bacterium]
MSLKVNGEGKNEVYILCIYSNVTLKWSFQELNDVMRWLYEITQAQTCKDAIALAWMEVNTPEEQHKLSAIRDFYLGQYDGKVQPEIDLEKIYCEINGLDI